MKKRFLIFFALAIIASSYSVESFPNNLNVNLFITNDSGQAINGSFELQFNITTSSACNGVLYSNYTNQTTSNGYINYSMSGVQIDFTAGDYYLCYYRQGSLKSVRQFGFAPYCSYAQNTTWAGIKSKPTSLSQFNDDLGNRGYTSLSNFTNDLGIGNSSFNQSLTDLLYSSIVWGYNHTQAANLSIFSAYDGRWSTTFNSTYSSKADYQFTTNNFNGSGNVSAGYFLGNGSLLNSICLTNGTGCPVTSGDNSSWNETRANLLYSAIIWGYNETIASNTSIFTTYDSRWSSTYNSTYASIQPGLFIIQNSYITNSTTAGINTTQIIVSSNLSIGGFREVDNGTCLNTYKGNTLIQSIGCG